VIVQRGGEIQGARRGAPEHKSLLVTGCIVAKQSRPPSSQARDEGG
jgi:hypothetical protein